VIGAIRVPAVAIVPTHCRDAPIFVHAVPTHCAAASDRHLDLRAAGTPTPNDDRAGSGALGKDYWQNRADYTVRATLDTTATSVKNETTLRYTNNSHGTLHFVWLQTEQNAFKATSLNSFIVPEDSCFGAREDGTDRDRLQIQGAGAWR